MNEAIHLLFPPRCITCGRNNFFHCPTCQIEWQRSYKNRIENIPVFSAALYSHSAGHILVRAKEDNDKRARAIIAQSMRRFIPPGSTVVPIPSSEQSIRRRGFDHSLLLARQLDPRAISFLRVKRRVKDQTALSHRERFENIHGAFEAGNFFLPRVVLVDDVITTGSTVMEAIRALREVKIAPLAVISAGLATHPIPNTISLGRKY